MKRSKTLDDRTIAALRGKGRQIDYIDPALPDFGLRVNPGKAKTWWVRVHLGPRRLRLTIGRWPDYTRDEAFEVAREWIRMAARDQDPRTKMESAGITLGKLFERYIAAQKEKGLRYWKNEEKWFRAFAAMTKRPAVGIERREVRELLTAKRARGAPSAENARALLSRVYRFGIAEDLVEVDPVAGIKRLAAHNARSRILSDEEIRTLWALWEADGQAGALAQQLMLLLGTRHTETLRIRQSNIGPDWLEIEPQYTKSGRPHIAPITRSVRRVVDAAAALAGASPWLFPSRLKESQPAAPIRASLAACRDAAGFHYTAHDLRRTTYSALRRLQIPEPVIEAFFSHARAGLRRHYDLWSYAPERQEAAEVWHADLDRILRRGEAGKVVALHRA